MGDITDLDIVALEDGGEGGSSDHPILQPIDVARYRAYLLSLQVQEKTLEALDAYAALLVDHYEGDDWACYEGVGYCLVHATADALGSILEGGSSSSSSSSVEVAIETLVGPLVLPSDGQGAFSALFTHLKQTTASASASASAATAAASSFSAFASLDTKHLTPALSAAKDTATYDADKPPSSSSSSSSSSAPTPSQKARGPHLALLQLLALRLELTSRALRVAPPSIPSSLPSAVTAALQGAFSRASEQYVSLVRSYCTFFGSASCCFSDLRAFLTPLLPPLPEGLEAFSKDVARASRLGSPSSSSSSSSSFTSSLLLSFVNKQDNLSILSTPFHSSAAPSSASDAAPSDDLFRWSFTLPASAITPLIEFIQLIRQRRVPLPAHRDRLNEIIATSHVVAAEQSKAAKATAGGGAKDGAAKKATSADDDDDDGFAAIAVGGKKKKGDKGNSSASSSSSSQKTESASFAAATASAPAPSSDPHKVASSLQFLTSELLVAPESAREVANLRDSYRRYATATQLSRYLGLLSLRSGGDAAYANALPPFLLGAAATAAAPREGALRAEAQALQEAWLCTLPLTILAAGGKERELQEIHEGDALAAIAAQILVELASRALAGRIEPTPPSSSTSTSPSQAEVDAPLVIARRYLWEAALIVDVAAEFSPSNSSLRFSALRLYAALGANAAIVELQTHRLVRAKHIARDTLSHTVFPHVQRIVWLEATKTMADDTAKFFRGVNQEFSDNARIAFLKGNYSTALDMLRLRRRLKESGASALARSAFLFNALGMTCAGGGKNRYGEALSLLDKCASFGPETRVPADAATFLRLRDNDERDIFRASNYDPPSLPLLHELRHGLFFPQLERASGSAAASTPPPSSALAVLECYHAAAAEYTACLLRVQAAVSSSPSTSSSSSSSASTALSPSSPLATRLRHLWGPMSSGGEGGSYERLLRRLNRDGTLLARELTLRALHETVTQQAPGGGAAAAAKIMGGGGGLGMQQLGLWGGGDSSPLDQLLQLFKRANVPLPSAITVSLSSAAAASSGSSTGNSSASSSSTTVSSSSSGMEAEAVGPFLLSEFNAGGILPCVDTGVSQESTTLRTTSFRLLASVLKAAATVPASGSSGGKEGDATAEQKWAVVAELLNSAAADLPLLFGEILSHKQFEGTDGSILGGAEAASAASTTSTASTSLIPSSSASASSSSPPSLIHLGAPINPALLAESTLLIHHVGIYATIALHFIAHAAAAAVTASSASVSTASAAGKKAAAAAAAPASSSSSAAAAAAAPTPPVSALAAKAASAAFIKSFTAHLLSIDAPLKAFKEILDATSRTERSFPLILAGCAPAEVATRSAGEWLAEYHRRTLDKKAGEKATVDAAMASVAAALKSGGVGAGYLAEIAASWASRVRNKVEKTVTHIGASYTNSMDKLRDEIAGRISMLKDA